MELFALRTLQKGLAERTIHDPRLRALGCQRRVRGGGQGMLGEGCSTMADDHVQKRVDETPDHEVPLRASPLGPRDAGSAGRLGMEGPAGSEVSSMQVPTVWRQEAIAMLRVAGSLRREAHQLPVESVLRRQLEHEAEDWQLQAGMRGISAPAA